MALSNHPPARQSTQNPKTAHLRAARPALRQAGSAVLNACEFLSDNDLVVATRLVDSCDHLLRRFAKLERRAAA